MRPTQNWHLDSPPDTDVDVAQDLVELRAPLVGVRRDETGAWSFEGPADSVGDSVVMTLGDVVNAWPHVAVLDDLAPGQVAWWDWSDNGWHIGALVGDAEIPAVDLHEEAWPQELPLETTAVVERAVVTGERPLADVQRDVEGFSFVGPPKDTEPVPEEFMLVRLTDAVRRWPHALGVVAALQPGEGVEWDAEQRHWEGYEFTRG